MPSLVHAAVPGGGGSYGQMPMGGGYPPFLAGGQGNMAPPQVTLHDDGTALASCLYSMTFTSRTGRNESTKPTRAEFQLRRSGNTWTIQNIAYRNSGPR